MELKLTDSIEKLSGVGAKRAALYKKLDVEDIYSLLTFYPRKYLDFADTTTIGDALLNENNAIKATVYKKQGEQRIRMGLSIFKVFVCDETGNLVITIFNSKYMFDALKENQSYYFYGKVTGDLVKREMISPLFVDEKEENLLRPVYNLTEGLSNKMIQGNMRDALAVWGDRLSDDIPIDIRNQHNLCQLRYAIENIHFPKDSLSLKLSQQRLIFEELLIFQLGLILLRGKNRKQTGIRIENTDIAEFYKILPFTLTNGQANAINEALEDLKKSVPMNRLVQGDVGCGKTMVAAALCYACFKNNCQSAIMAPTQILADQHYKTISTILKPLGVNCCLLTGAKTAKQRGELIEQIKNGAYSVIIGTHALVQESVEFQSLALVVTDEQHRFGVAQRASLAGKGHNPHLLVMSATPIPRTLALIVYGDLDISTIRELPSGRQSVDTLAISTRKRMRALSFIKDQLEQGRQAYIVCPLIEDNESDLLSTTAYINSLAATPLANYRIGCLNGKLKAKEKDSIMAAFKANEIQILVSTTVVEVGVDVPNATVMMIENAERFGLSQLHQLRGRVGRGEHKSYCILVSDNSGVDNRKRIEIMKSTSDGFEIAKQDLKLRGPGDFFGVRQHGLPSLKLANMVDDIKVLQETQLLAKEIIQRDPNLSSLENIGLRSMVKRLFARNEQAVQN